MDEATKAVESTLERLVGSKDRVVIEPSPGPLSGAGYIRRNSSQAKVRGFLLCPTGQSVGGYWISPERVKVIRYANKRKAKGDVLFLRDGG